MILPVFTDSFVCQSREKCHLCLDPGERGEQFRSVHAKTHQMPGPGRYECPLGVTGDNLPPPRRGRARISMRVRLLMFGLLAWTIWRLASCRGTRWIFVREEDRGAGDTIARMIGWVLAPIRISYESVQVRMFFRRMMGKRNIPLPPWSQRWLGPLWAAIYRAASGECGSCGDIQGKLNDRFPYSWVEQRSGITAPASHVVYESVRGAIDPSRSHGG